jgi:hypothetical protein
MSPFELYELFKQLALDYSSENELEMKEGVNGDEQWCRISLFRTRALPLPPCGRDPMWETCSISKWLKKAGPNYTGLTWKAG